ncbi:hypothetical protein A2U01_0080986 [Trifolium medium]|uniref:Uncharacterized protein n=1 Tax=Trifolium medium TaxID=97028 RepID=A0A392TF26_9FABA|nr:hypothetical protein [Trifolium medium]
MVGGRRGSMWWREVSRIRDGKSAEGERGWFEDSIERRVCTGVDTFFGWIRGYVVFP